MECFLGNLHHLLCLVLKTSSFRNTLLPFVKIWQELFLKPLKYYKHDEHRINTISQYTHTTVHTLVYTSALHTFMQKSSAERYGS